MATVGRDTVRVSSAPAVRDGRAAERLVSAFFTQLSRAVQRASMYPPGHPAVGVGLGPFVEASRLLLGEGRLTVAVGRTRLLVASGVNPPTEHESGWLAARLFDKEIATLTIEPDFDAEEASAFVTWLARPVGHADESQPELTTVQMSHFDGSRVRFRDEVSPGRESTPEAATTWRALTSALADVYGLSGDALLLEDPAVLADRIRQAIHASEGTGIAALSDHLIELHGELSRVGPESRAVLLHRLAALVECLSPELRGSLLSVSTEDADSKVELVEAVVEKLPTHVVRDIVGNLRIERSPVLPVFGRFLRKLVRLSLTDPALGEGLDLRFRQAGLPTTLFAADEPGQPADAVPPVPPADEIKAEPLSQEYRESLERLASRTPTRVAVPPEAFEDATPSAIDRHVARIALLQAGKDPTNTSSEACLRCLRDIAPRELERNGLDLLAEIAELALRLGSAGENMPAEIHSLVETVLDFYRQPPTVDVVIRAIAERPIGSAGPAGVMLAAGGGAAVRMMLSWLETATDPQARARGVAALLGLDAEIVRQTVLPGLASMDQLAEAFAAVIEHAEPARAIELALYLSAHQDPEARLRAITWLFGCALTSGKRQRVLQRALADTDLRIVALGVDAAGRLDQAMATDALVTFIERPASAELLPLQLRAVRALGADRDHAAARLSRLLAGRRFACSHRARRLSVTLAAVLGQSSHAAARAAARAWRYSPAGLLSLIAGTRAESS